MSFLERVVRTFSGLIQGTINHRLWLWMWSRILSIGLIESVLIILLVTLWALLISMASL